MDADELHYLLEQADRRELCDALTAEFEARLAVEAQLVTLRQERDTAHRAVEKLAGEWADLGLKLDRAEARVKALEQDVRLALYIAYPGGLVNNVCPVPGCHPEGTKQSAAHWCAPREAARERLRVALDGQEGQ